VTPGAEKVSPKDGKDDIAMSPEPSLTVIKPSVENQENLAFSKNPDGPQPDRKERGDENLDTDHPHGHDSGSDVLGVRSGQPAEADSVADAVPDGRGHDIGIGKPDPAVEAIIEQTETHLDQFDLGRITKAKLAEAGNYAAPPAAGGDASAAHAGIVALAEAKGSSPPKRGSGGYAQQLEKFNEALKDQGEKDPEVAALAAQMFVKEKPAMANPYYRSFRGDYGDYLGRARGVLDKQRAKPPPPPEPEGGYEPEYFPELVPEGPDQAPWNLTLDTLKVQVDGTTFFAYYMGTRLVSLDDGAAVVQARNEGARDFLRARAGYIGQILSGVVGKPVGVAFEVGQEVKNG